MSTFNIEQVRSRAEAGNAQAQFLLSQLCLRDNDLPGMIHWLREASTNNVPEAIGALGHCFEKGRGVSQDMAAAMDHYERAIAAGSKHAAYHKAELLYKSRVGAENTAAVYELLISAADAGIVPALRVIGYLMLQDDTRCDLARECLRRGAVAGDPVSAFMIGQHLADAQRYAEATHYLQQAASADIPFAKEILAGLPSSPAIALPEESIEFGSVESLYPGARGAVSESLCEDPPITVYRDVLDIVDRAYLMVLSRPFLRRAHVINPDGDSSGMVSDVRTNMTTYLPFGTIDIIGRYIELKILAETGESLDCSEPMSILHYAKGEYYRPHVDYFEPDHAVSEDFMQDGGQRTLSAVTYLTAPSVGGGTSFPKLDLTVPPQAGSTLWFRNCDEQGQVDERSLHAGDTVKEGEKWVVTKWFRERPTQYLQA